jgi:hypothetical protein
MSLRSKEETKPISLKDYDEYLFLLPHLKRILDDISTLSLKKPDVQLNTLKIKMINGILERINRILEQEKSFELLQLLAEEDLPTISDALLIIGQYHTALAQYREAHFYHNGFDWVWNIKEGK